MSGKSAGLGLTWMGMPKLPQNNKLAIYSEVPQIRAFFWKFCHFIFLKPVWKQIYCDNWLSTPKFMSGKILGLDCKIPKGPLSFVCESQINCTWCGMHKHGQITSKWWLSAQKTRYGQVSIVYWTLANRVSYEIIVFDCPSRLRSVSYVFFLGTIYYISFFLFFHEVTLFFHLKIGSNFAQNSILIFG